jgi:hypothetical protein
VPGRIDHLVSTGAIKAHAKEQAYSLSFAHRTRLTALLKETTERDIAFRAAIRDAVNAAAASLEIDYAFDADALALAGHECIIWFLHAQGKQLKDATGALLNILNAEDLLSAYVKAQADLKKPLNDVDILRDILPHALYNILSSGEGSVRRYLRDKGDIFIMEAFMQASPDVQKACKALFGNDVIYVETTILIRALCEKFSVEEDGPLLQTLRYARTLGVKFFTFHAYLEELVSHLKGPVLLEWRNHEGNVSRAGLPAYIRTAPAMIGVLRSHEQRTGVTMEEVVHDIIGNQNEVENAIEFIKEEFGILTQVLPDRKEAGEQVEWEELLGNWIAAKRMWPTMSRTRFEVLVRNDVNAFSGVLHLRRGATVVGNNYGHKIWLLSLDRMFWKIPNLLGKQGEDLYRIAMSIDYLVNFVATLAHTVGAGPATKCFR